MYSNTMEGENRKYSFVHEIYVSVQSKQYLVHPSRETPERKRFSRKFDPQFYGYWEYMDAWFKVFYIQNKEMSHSCFLPFRYKNA